MSKRDADLLLDDMLRSLEKITEYIGTMDQQSFTNDSRTWDSVVRGLEIIGEAAARLPEEFKATHPGIPWRRVVGLRNRIVYEYFGVDVGIVWSVVSRDLPQLRDPGYSEPREVSHSEVSHQWLGQRYYCADPLQTCPDLRGDRFENLFTGPLVDSPHAPGNRTRFSLSLSTSNRQSIGDDPASFEPSRLHS